MTLGKDHMTLGKGHMTSARGHMTVKDHTKLAGPQETVLVVTFGLGHHITL